VAWHVDGASFTALEPLKLDHPKNGKKWSVKKMVDK
jgi:hypothetical protein